MDAAADRTALIVGASRGLGLGLAKALLDRGWRVTGTVRGRDRTGLHDLADQIGERLDIESVDITEPDQIAGLAQRLAGRRFDLLFVNAGVSGDTEAPMGTVSTEMFDQVMVTNVLGPLRVIEACQGLLAPDATVAAMSSGLGSIAGNTTGSWETYRASKAALNMALKSFAARASGKTVIAMAPGWVRTDMGGPGAPLGVEESTTGMAEVLEREAGRPGMRYLDYRGRTLEW